MLPDGCKLERWVYWSKPAYCAWAILLPSSRVYVYDERRYARPIAATVARDIRLHSEELRLELKAKLGRTIGNIEMQKGAGDAGESTADTFARQRLPVWCDPSDPIQGWARLRHWLQSAPDGDPWLLIDPSCGILIRAFASLVADPDDPEDVDAGQEDQAAHAVRLGLMARPSPRILKPASPAVPEDSFLALLREELGHNNPRRAYGEVA